VVTTSCAYYQCTRDCGCAERPAFPAPSASMRDARSAQPGQVLPRECGCSSLRGAIATKQSIPPRTAAWIASLRSQWRLT